MSDIHKSMCEILFQNTIYLLINQLCLKWNEPALSYIKVKLRIITQFLIFAHLLSEVCYFHIRSTQVKHEFYQTDQEICYLTYQ